MTAREIVRLMNEEERAVLDAMHKAEAAIAVAAERVAEAYREGGRTIYVGAGTSGRIAAMDAAEMVPTFSVQPGRFVALMAGGYSADSTPMEEAEDQEHAAVRDLNDLDLDRQDVVIGLAASGKTPYTVSAVRHAHQKGLWTCGIASVKGSPLLRAADLPVFAPTGPEVLAGSTRLKAGTAQKLILNRISTIAMVLSGKVMDNLMVDVHATNSKLRERCVRIVRELSTATSEEAQEVLERNGWNVRRALAELTDLSTTPH